MKNFDWYYPMRNVPSSSNTHTTTLAVRHRLISAAIIPLMMGMGSLTHAASAPGASKDASYPAQSPMPKVVVVNSDQVLQCGQVQSDVARLACFDKLTQGDTPASIAKAPLDLAKSVVTSIQEGKAVAVLAQDSDAAVPDTVATQDKTLLAQVGVTKDDVKRYSSLSLLYDLDENDPRGILTLRPHYPTYVMPVWYNATPNRDIHSPTRPHVTASHDSLQNLDTKMQISLKTKLMQDVFDTNADVWFGYTQQSYWQLYNRHSRPFRSTAYQPEMLITQPVKAALPLGGDLRVLGAGLVHESNGQDDPLSRSWNRAYVMAGMEWGKLSLVSRLWAIGSGGNNNSDNDNPDIDDYMGYGDVRWLYDMGDQRGLGGLLRYNPKTEKGAIQLDYSHPITGGMKAYIQLFHGYGENVQDYNHESTNVGIGLMFNDFRGL